MTGPEWDTDSSIAIVGMSARVPGADCVASYWDNLVAGREAVRELTPAELESAGIGKDQRDAPDYVPYTAPLDGYDTFDAGLFGFSPGDAAMLDPQHRLFLEAAFDALTSGGFPPVGPDPLTGVFAAAGTPHYLLLAHENGAVRRFGRDAVVTAADKDFLATRTAYKLGLEGPAVCVQTACSSSLVAVHLARQSLLLGECDLALAGGVSIRLPHHAGYRFVPGGIHARDGHCRPYDAAATGTVHGSGVGVVVLRRLADAIEAGDDIWAAIRGSAVTNDGARRAGYTAPGVLGQYRAIATALEVAGIEPASVSYVEGHGTATALGDPIEVEALAMALGQRQDHCLLGSVKGNIGHLGPAAGIAGLIKVALSMRHRQLPPSINFGRPNAELRLGSRPVRIAAELSAWDAPDGRARRAGVSSFGMGGTNAHVVLEEHAQAPGHEAADKGSGGGHEVLVLSAASAPALARLRGRMAERLRTREPRLADVASTLRASYGGHRFRCSVTARSAGEAADRIAAAAHAELAADSEVVFILPGQGSQRAGMLAGLYTADQAARSAVDEFLGAAGDEAPLIRQALLDPDCDPGACARTEIAQPAVFITSVVGAAQLMKAGLVPGYLVGHSAGELAAAALAGTWPPASALAAVLARGRAMAKAPPGAMIFIRSTEAEVAGLLAKAGASVAARNSPGSVVASGPAGAIALASRLLDEAGIGHRLLRTSGAFHHPSMASAEAELADALGRLTAAPPAIAVISTVTGRRLGPAPAPAAHWLAQLTMPVEFSAAIAAVPAIRRRIFVEIGAVPELSGHLKAQAAPGDVVLTTASSAGVTAESLGRVTGLAWAAGAQVSWPRGRRCVPLPGYPFERRRYWHGDEAAPIASAPPDRRRAQDRPAAADPLGTVLGIWRDLLGYAEIDADDDFFSLGGHSLLGLALCDRLREFSELPRMRWLYRHPTPRAQASAIFSRMTSERAS